MSQSDDSGNTASLGRGPRRTRGAVDDEGAHEGEVQLGGRRSASRRPPAWWGRSLTEIIRTAVVHFNTGLNQRQK